LIVICRDKKAMSEEKIAVSSGTKKGTIIEDGGNEENLPKRCDGEDLLLRLINRACAASKSPEGGKTGVLTMASRRKNRQSPEQESVTKAPAKREREDT